MKSNLQFDFIVNKENNSIIIKREFAAELPIVWGAYTKPEVLVQWWAPKPWKAKSKTMDFREGGHWHYAMCGPNGEEHWGLMSYVKIVPNKHISGLDAFCDVEAQVNKELPQSKWEMTFSSNGNTTLVEYLTMYGDLAQLEATIQMGFKEGITMAMEGLDEVLLHLEK